MNSVAHVVARRRGQERMRTMLADVGQVIELVGV
jgi:hypothetical protein